MTTSYAQFAYVYDELMADMPYPEWLAFAREAWARFGKPKTIVDLGCGTGSLMIPLASEGYHVTGIDLSSDMLAVAQQKLESSTVGSRLLREGKVRLIEQDMRDLELPAPVDSVISFCDCLNYLLEEEDIVETLRRAYGAVKPGGTFLFDVHHPRQFEQYEAEQPFIYNEDNVAYLWTCDLDAERCEIEHHLTIFARQAGTPATQDLFQRFEEVHIERAYDPTWMTEQLKGVGFTEVHIFGDFTWEAPTNETGRLFYIAVK
ncbi:class I SAM-dependent DNA methyltransferase [Paenibacillus terrigena]|uniref:class I SAM-dependent DNA methyltransferase n=1 Tax=Paenibacillus terrigena TaxID=369333 RepID=UPI00035CA067|nr:class I SAM-dependent methyltransferase [Paenibacillus terrigena]